MEQFKGLSRDTSREKAEFGTSPYNRNIVYDKKQGSITQENGFTFQQFVPGVIIGQFSTNTHIVYITYDVETTNTLISYCNTATNVLTTVINTSYFKYEIGRPIEIIAWYNFNQELIIMFSDGIFEKSSAPRLINLMDLGIELDNNKEFINQREADSTLLFSIILQPRYTIKYGNAATHGADLLFFTVAYILPDGITRTKFIGTLAEGFPLYGFSTELRKAITFKIEDLDLFFKEFVIGIIAYRDNAIFGYVTDNININSSTYEYEFTGVENLTTTNVDDIIVETSIFNRVKSLTIGNDLIVLGGVTTKTSKSYQKYANNLKLNLYFDDRKDNRHQAPLLCPDEVYYFTIALAFNNGTYSEEFHIPGEEPSNSDLTIIDKTNLGLLELEEENIKSFKIINKGDWAIPTTGLPNFNNLNEVKLNWGYWQNEELYPNAEDYNGTIDYDGVTSIINGRDLRNTNVKLHRVPGLDNLSKKFPMRLGMDIKPISDDEPDLHNRLPAFAINVDNFLTAFNSVIVSDNIVGYRLSFVKKDNSSKIVEDINFIKPLIVNAKAKLISPETLVTMEYNIDYDDSSAEYDRLYKYYQFGYSKVKSVNLSLYKGTIEAKVVKANYGLFNTVMHHYPTINYPDTNVRETEYRDFTNIDTNTKGTLGIYTTPFTLPLVPNECLSFLITNEQKKYAVIKSIEQTIGGNKADNNLFINEQIKMKVINSNTVFGADALPPLYSKPIPNYKWNPLNYLPNSMDDFSTDLILQSYKSTTNSYEAVTHDALKIPCINISCTILKIKNNIHNGLNPKNFVVVGATNLNNPATVFKDFGDTFTNNIYNEIATCYRSYATDSVFYFQKIYSGMLSLSNNSLISFTKDRLLGKEYKIVGTSNNVDGLLTFSYKTNSYTKELTRQLNSLISNLAFNYTKKYINKFPFRIVKSLSIQSENLSTLNVRTFLANAYYDLPALRGDIIYVIGFDKGVYCQQRYSLSIFQLKEKLNSSDANSAYLAESDLFAYKPTVIIDEDNKGYIGSVHQFGKKLTKQGLLTSDAERGKIYLIAGATPKVLSDINMSNDFMELLNNVIQKESITLFNTNTAEDNPYNANGVIFGVDDRTERLLITILNYEIKANLPENVIIVDGLPYLEQTIEDVITLIPLDIKHSLISINKSVTFSFSFTFGVWIAEHDYKPQVYINTNKLNYAGINIYPTDVDNISNTENCGHIYYTNKQYVKGGKYFYLTAPTIFESYTDLLFNSRYDLSKWFKSVIWRSTAVDNLNRNIYDKTIDAIILYTDYQCSGRIELDKSIVSLIRNSEGAWNFNEFRDMIKNDKDLPILKDGSFDTAKVHLIRTWFDKSDFISNFIVVRFIMNNIEDVQIHIHNVNVEARVSDRI